MRVATSDCKPVARASLTLWSRGESNTRDLPFRHAAFSRLETISAPRPVPASPLKLGEADTGTMFSVTDYCRTAVTLVMPKAAFIASR